MCVCVRTWYLYIYACVYVFVHLCVYARVYLYVYAYLCIDCGSWYQCFSVWTVSYMRMYFRVAYAQVFLNTCMRVCGGIGSGVCFSLFMFSACYWRGRLCFGRGRVRGICLLYCSIFAGVRVVGVCVLVYARTHTQTIGYLMWAQVWDGNLEGQKNPDRLKCSIHVDCIGVHSTFVYIYAVLRVLMIWANCFFSFNMSFLFRKVEDVTTISKSQSLTSVSIKDCTLRVPNKTTTLFLYKQ